MKQLVIPRPPDDEAAPFYSSYLAACPDGRVGMQLEAQVHELEDLCAGLSDSEAMFRYASGKWTIKEVVGHLLDTERVFACRLLRISRGDPIALSGFDDDAYVSEGLFNRRSVTELVAEFTLQRASTIALIDGVPESAWARQGTANGFPVSARALVYIIVGHTAHHFRLLRERYRLPVATSSLA